jgi:hypothetical protein
LRQEYETIVNAELKLGLDVNHYMGKCSPNNAKNNSQTFRLTPGHLEVLTVLTQTQRLQVLKELYLSLDDEGKVKCCNDIFFEGNSSLKRVIIPLIQSIIACTNSHMDEMMTFMDEAFLTLATSNGLCSNPKYFVSNSIKAMKRLSSNDKPNLVYKFSQMLNLQKAANPMEPVIQLDRMSFGLLEYVIQFFTAININQVQSMQLFDLSSATVSTVLLYTLWK